MICLYCHQARNETAAPCPHCDAPAAEQAGANNWAIQQNAQNQWNGQAEQQGWIMPPQVEQPSWGVSPQDQQQSWNMSPQVEQPSWGIAPQDQQWGWSIPPQDQQSQPSPQPVQDQQWGWSIPPQNQPSQPSPQPVQNQQWGWSIPPQDQQGQSSPQSVQGWNSSQQQSSPGTPQAQPAQANPQMGLVPYQGGMEMQAASSRTSMLQILPNDLAAKMLPAIHQDEMAVYIPPIYTKPRAIIPRYRAISGLLSVMLVTLLLCTGASYAAKATGTLNTLTRFVTGDSHPPSIQKRPAIDLPEPKTLIETGPVFGTIYSATTTSHVDSVGLPVLPEHIFKVNQIIHLTYAVKSAKAGTVQIQWFSNGNPLADPISPPFDPKDGQNKHADATIAYALPAEGWVELRWNNQLAMRLYFVVRA